ncbi:MAG: sugar phosphate isomerase/epimerase family protein [Mycolicibacterium sp.]|uniref:sugar phosphate isomerase/epimerase family protein n=1 Tax=Mycolicibacterium sp. TaxID=2320850 RepID=UPI003D139AF7
MIAQSYDPPLAAFADEISPKLSEALALLRIHEINSVDLRSVDNVGILELDDRQIGEVQRMLVGEHVGVKAIATPIGKTPVDVPATVEWARFQRALEIAQRLQAGYIRLFTGYGPTGTWRSEADREAWREPVASRIAAMDTEATSNGVTILVENNEATLAESPQMMMALLNSTGSDTVRTAFDAANYMSCGYDPYPALCTLQSWIGCLHVKDVDDAGRITVAGLGGCQWPKILDRLAQAPVRGYLSLEPHLQSSGPAGGFTGVAKFNEAVTALSALLGR